MDHPFYSNTTTGTKEDSTVWFFFPLCLFFPYSLGYLDKINNKTIKGTWTSNFPAIFPIPLALDFWVHAQGQPSLKNSIFQSWGGKCLRGCKRLLGWRSKKTVPGPRTHYGNIPRTQSDFPRVTPSPPPRKSPSTSNPSSAQDSEGHFAQHWAGMLIC